MVTPLEIMMSWLSLPIYVWQGLATQRKTQRMPPPEVPAFCSFEGKGDTVRVLMIGDSTIAGVGVQTFENSLSGIFPKLLAEKTGKPVVSRTCGNSSATAESIRDYVLPNLEHAEYDYVFLSIGVNDSKNFHSGKRFCKAFGSLIWALRTRFPDAKIIWSGIVDVGNIPALPSPLNKILSIRSKLLDRNGRILCMERSALAPQSNWQPKSENFSEDRFHCSAQGYYEWADELSDYVAKLETSQTKD